MTRAKGYLKITIDRVYEGRWGRVASVRSYQVESARKKGLGLRITVKNRHKEMYIEYENLDDCDKGTTLFVSRFGRGQRYTLWDYPWVDPKPEEQLDFLSVAQVSKVRR